MPDLYQRYEQLAPDDRVVLQVAAFLEPNSASAFAPLLNKVKEKLLLGRCNVKVQLEGLLKEGLLQGDLRQFCCPSGIVEDVAASAYREKRARAIVKVVLAHQGYSQESYIQAKQRYYNGCPTKFLDLLRQFRTRLRFVQGASQVTTLDCLPEEIGRQLAIEAVACRLNKLETPDDWVQWLLPRIDRQSRHEADMVALVWLLRKQQPTFSAHTGMSPPLLSDLFRPLFHGKPEESLRLLNQRIFALAGRAVFTHELQDLLWTALCLSVDDEASAQSRFSMNSSEFELLFSWLQAVRKGDSQRPSERLRRVEKEAEPLWRFYFQLAYYWADCIDLIDRTLIEALCSQAKSCGFELLVDELEALRQYLQSAVEPQTPVLRLLKPVERWKTVLEKVEQWAQPNSASGNPEQRLVWEVVFENDLPKTVLPRLQKIGASGKWTSGRVIFRHDAAALDCLDEHDRKVIDRWQPSYWQGRYGHFPEEPSLLPELVGHPRVYRFEPRLQPLSLERFRPHLSVRQSEEGTRVRLEVGQRLTSALTVRWLGEQRYGICELSTSVRELVAIFGKEEFVVPDSGLERAFNTFRHLLNEEIDLVGDCSGMQVDTSVSADGRIRIRLRPIHRGLTCEVAVQPVPEQRQTYPPGQGPATIVSRRLNQSVEFSRDLNTELERYRQVLEACPSLDVESNHLGIEEALGLLEGARKLPPEWALVEWPEGQSLKLRDSVSSSALRLKVSSSNNWFALEGHLNLEDGDSLALAEVLARLREGERFLQLSDGSYLALTEQLQRQLSLLERAGERADGEALRLPWFATEILEGAEVDGDSAWELHRKKVMQARELPLLVPTGLKATLRSYQEDGFRWLMRSAHWAPGVCLADDMGLGKTLQTLALLLARHHEGPALVVAPTSVCANWLEECLRFAPDLKPMLYSEGARERAVSSLSNSEVVICSYGLMVRDLESLKQRTWGTLVLDEAQAIKNSETLRSKAALALDAKFRLATTGTPIENRMEELWALFRFLVPGLLGSKKSFTRRFSDGSQPSARATLAALVRPFLLRRLKSEVLQELPARTDITLTVELSREERVFYEGLRREAVRRVENSRGKLFAALVELTRLRRACCHPDLIVQGLNLQSSKHYRFRQILSDILESGHKVLVFSQFVDHLRLAREATRELKMRSLYLDGSTPTRERARLVKAFQNGEAEVFFISLKAGGFGLNLTAASFVIHLDPWWNPAVEDQASDRAHRIGQQQPVTVYRLITQGTIEEKILRLHGEKRELADQLLSESDQAAALSSEEILSLLEAGTASLTLS